MTGKRLLVRMPGLDKLLDRARRWGARSPHALARARILLDSTQQLVCLLDRDGNVLEAGRAVRTVPGIEVIGRPFWEAPWWKDLPEVQAQLRAAVAEAAAGRSVRHEVEQREGDGRTGLLSVDLSLTPVRDPAGRVAYLMAEGRDVTDRKRVEAELLRKSRDLEGLTARLAQLDEVKTSLFASSAPAGGGAAELPLVLAVEDNPEMSRFLARILGTRFRVATAPDGVAGLALALELIPDLILTDVMMPRMDGEQLVHEIRRHEALQGTPIILLTAWSDDELRVRMLKAGALDYITKPFSAEELLSRVGNLVALKRARQVLQDELQSRARDLETLAAELVLRKRQLQAALETARLERDKAERASRAKSDFLSLVSHELLTPVTALQLRCQRLERDRQSPLAPAHLAIVRHMLASCRRLAEVIRSLLEQARVESGRLTLSSAPVDVSTLAAEVLDELRAQADEKGLDVHLLVEPPLPPARTDERLLRLVIANLASNAVKFTQAGSVAVTLGYRDGAHRIVVKDSGPGIPAEERSRIFEPFEQLEPLRHKHLPGVGLGLALARTMAAALGGRIELDPAEGPGTTFTVILPEADETASTFFQESDGPQHRADGP